MKELSETPGIRKSKWNTRLGREIEEKRRAEEAEIRLGNSRNQVYGFEETASYGRKQFASEHSEGSK